MPSKTETEWGRVYSIQYSFLLTRNIWRGGGAAEWFWELDLKSLGPGSNLPPYRYLDLFLVVLSSNPRPRSVNNQLVSLPPVGILNSLCSI